MNVNLQRNSRKVLLAITNGDLGGAQSHVINIAGRLAEKSEVICLVGDGGGPLEESLRRIGVDTIVLSIARRISPLRDIAAIFRIRSWLRTYRPHLIHVHSSKAGFVVRLAAVGLEIPVIYTAHGWGFKPGVPALRRFIVWLCEFITSFMAVRIICVSEYDLAIGRRYLPGVSGKLVLIKNGIPDCERQSASDSAIPTIIMVSRFQEPKLQSLLIDAFLLLPSNANLWFVGDGPDLERTRKYWSTKQTNKTVVFWGAQTNIAEILAKCEIFVLLSVYEGFPISILEAMRAGLPIVASGVGGIREQIIDGEQGFLIENRRPEEVAEKLKWLLENPEERTMMGRRARARFEEEFSDEHMWQKTSHVYESVLNKY